MRAQPAPPSCSLATFALLAVLATACGSRGEAPHDDTTLAGPATEPDSATLAARAPTVSTRAVPPARDADQAFLRRMLDGHERALATTHALMMEPAGHDAHGKAGDPASFDGRLDQEKQQMLALLARHYGEQYSPVAATAPPAQSAGDASPPDHETGMGLLAAQLDSGAVLAARTASRLQRPEVRALATRLAASGRELARVARATAGMEGMPMMPGSATPGAVPVKH